MSSSWTMFFDGSKRQQGAGAGVVLVSPKGMKLRYVLQLNFSNASNNEAEYEALLHGMRMAKTCGATRLAIYDDSNLVVQQAASCDVTPRLLQMRLPGVPEDRRPSGSAGRPNFGPLLAPA